MLAKPSNMYPYTDAFSGSYNATVGCKSANDLRVACASQYGRSDA